MQPSFVVHWLQGHVILQVFGKETFVGHMVAQSIVQLGLCIVHKSIPSSLQKKEYTLFILLVFIIINITSVIITRL